MTSLQIIIDHITDKWKHGHMMSLGAFDHTVHVVSGSCILIGFYACSTTLWLSHCSSSFNFFGRELDSEWIDSCYQ